MHVHASDEPGGGEGAALLMHDLEAGKEEDGPSQNGDIHDHAHDETERAAEHAINRFSRGNSFRRKVQDGLGMVTRLFGSATAGERSPQPASSRGITGMTRTVFNYPEPGQKLRSTAWLDGLRGLAALEVFVFHYMDRWMDKALAWGVGRYRDPAWFRLPFFRTFYASGDTAVCVFFAISGYVLTHRMLSLLRQKRLEDLYSSLSSAVFRRGIRLYMPVVIETFSLMILGRYFGLPKPSGWINEPTLFLELKRWFWNLLHLFIPLRYPDRWDEILNIYDGTISWTIPLEYYGSLIVYMILLLFSRTRSYSVRFYITVALIVCSFCKDDWIAGQFLLGMSFAEYQLETEHRSRQPNRVQSRPRVRAMVFLGVFLFGFYLAGLPGGHYLSDEQKFQLWPRPFYDWISQPLAALGLYANRQVDRYLDCLAGICIVIGVGETAILRRITETRFVQYLGRISFGLYLCHIFVHTWLTPFDDFWMTLVGVDPKAPRQESLALVISYFLMMIPATTLNLFVAGLFERYLDSPSIKMAKAFEKWCLSKGSDDEIQVSAPQLPRTEATTS